MLDQSLLKILACPETKQSVSLADADFLSKINSAINAGTVMNKAQQKVAQPLEAALIREDGKCCYPVREDIPVMLIEEAIELN